MWSNEYHRHGSIFGVSFSAYEALFRRRSGFRLISSTQYKNYDVIMTSATHIHNLEYHQQKMKVAVS